MLPYSSSRKGGGERGGGGGTDRQGRGLTKHLHLGRCGWHRDLEVLENGIDLGVEVLHPRTQRLLCLDLGNIAAPFLRSRHRRHSALV